jgi:hypothetical protein
MATVPLPGQGADVTYRWLDLRTSVLTVQDGIVDSFRIQY